MYSYSKTHWNVSCTLFTPGSSWHSPRLWRDDSEVFRDSQARDSIVFPMFFDGVKATLKGKNLLGMSMATPWADPDDVSSDTKLDEWEQRVRAICCSQSFDSLKLRSLVAILEGLTPQAPQIFGCCSCSNSKMFYVKNARNFCKRLVGKPSVPADGLRPSCWYMLIWGLP